MNEWINVIDRTPSRNEPDIELKINVYKSGERHPILMNGIRGQYIDGKFIVDLPEEFLSEVVAWKEPSPEQSTFNFIRGKYFKNSENPTVKTFKYPNKY